MDQDRNAPLQLFLGDHLRLRKPHPCGGYEWTVRRLGADIGLTCTTCGRHILLPRREVQRRLRAFVARGPGYEAARALIEGADAVPAEDDAVTTGPDEPTGPSDTDAIRPETPVVAASHGG